MATATGTFEVTDWQPEAPYDQEGDVSLGHVVLRKTFAGDLDGTSEVHMTSVALPEHKSAAYVALEHVRGTLAGKRGGFVLLHSAFATSTADSLEIRVVPDMGTGDLAGITGTLTITRDESGAHTWTLDYDLA
ncbi:DUF3224 domain-containing protein [Actinokineospora enzanensis]|uniref:DUF3224 domain-containing protein n=1 Tax=Actinokineospora enzanensis TaxID=155975 RepID=UPI0003626D46|nr:DUF3224 domain-containing protein [Actinokineospora enzanensis]